MTLGTNKYFPDLPEKEHETMGTATKEDEGDC
jgi:hypothetical protein